MDISEFLQGSNVRIGAIGIGGPNGPGIVGIANGGGVGFMSVVGDDAAFKIAQNLESELNKTTPSIDEVKRLFAQAKKDTLPWPLFANLGALIIEKLPQLTEWVKTMMK